MSSSETSQVTVIKGRDNLHMDNGFCTGDNEEKLGVWRYQKDPAGLTYLLWDVEKETETQMFQ